LQVWRPGGRLPARTPLLPHGGGALGANSITIISTFFHLCEAYLDISPHFHLWRHFFELKKTGKGIVVGSVGFMLHQNMKSEYIDLTLPDNTTG
jgi:hypothetical protein